MWSARSAQVSLRTRKQEVELWLLGELGGAAEPPVDRVEGRGEGLVCPGQVLGSRLVLRAWYASADRFGEPGRLAQYLVAPVVPRVGDRPHDCAKRGHSVPVGVGEIGAGVERPSVGSKPHRHRPAALAGHGLHGLHVDAVDIGALFPVDLDVDVETIHLRRGLLVFEGLVCHDVAPVAGGVADAEEDGHVSPT